MDESELPWAKESMLCVKSMMSNNGSLELAPVVGFEGLPAQEQETLLDERNKGGGEYVMTMDAVAARPSLRLTLSTGPKCGDLTGSEHIVLRDMARAWSSRLAYRLVKEAREEADGE